MRYKILFISSWFPNKLEPTNGNFVQRHAEAVSLMHNVEILHAIGDPRQSEIFLFDDATVKGLRTLIVYYKKTKNPALNFLRRMNAYKKGFSRMQRPDFVHANVLQNTMLFALYLKKKYRIPYVVSEHWSGFLKMNWHRLSKTQLFTAKFIAKNAACILPVSNFLLNDLKALGFKNKMEVVENVVDTDLFKVKEDGTNHFVFLHISNLIPLKNPDQIIKTAIALRENFTNFDLQIGGDGDLGALNTLIKKHQAEEFIKTFGILTLPEVARKMRDSDCFVLFSDYENFPCVLLESLSSGTPAIATKVGGIPEILNDKNGIVIPNSSHDLYEAMKSFLEKKTDFSGPDELHQYIEDRFSKRVIARKFDEIYQQISLLEELPV